MFFVLSGFLVSGLLFQDYQQHGAISVRRFYIRRGLKIYPAFYFFLFVTLAVRITMGTPPPLLSVFAEVCFLQSYLRGMWDHTWSLAVEEHFYIGLPLVLALCARTSRHRDPFAALPRAFILLGCALLSFRLGNACLHGYRHQTHLFPTHLRLDSLMMGVVLSYWYHFQRGAFDRFLGTSSRSLLVLGTLMLAPAFIFELGTTVFTHTLGLTMFYVGSGAVLCGLLLTPLPHSRLVRALAYIGSHSYSVYLWHLAVRDWGGALIERAVGRPLPFVAAAAVYVVGSVIVGVIMASVIEFPVLRLRDRWFPSRTKSPVEVVAPARLHRQVEGGARAAARSVFHAAADGTRSPGAATSSG